MVLILIETHRRCHYQLANGRMERGGQGLPEVSAGPAMPYPTTNCRRATTKRGGPPAGRVACGRLLPFWTPHAVRL